MVHPFKLKHLETLRHVKDDWYIIELNNDLTRTILESYIKLFRLQRFQGQNYLWLFVPKNNYMNGPLPKEVMKLKQLTEFDFDGLLPEGLFTSLIKLRVINTNQNGFTGDIAGEIGALANLLRL
ncbi:hypothetical protein BGZ47_002508 [Haplosporangium gracile]|nr:hypothetical protein BGZ47_002508 [Haplosporangium gracile]